MADISMFASYSQRENIVTNNTMLLLKTIYNDSVLVFDRLVSRLVGEDSLGFAPRFEQQSSFKTAAGTKISDGLIEQKQISIFVETKTTDWFHPDQVERYRDFLAGTKSDEGHSILILLSNFETKERLYREVLNQLSSGSEEIPIVPVGFDELLQAVKEEVKSGNDVIRAMIDDFEKYLTDDGLLPTWLNTLEIIPMGVTLEENKHFKCYSCPNTGRGYSHARAKYLGFYSQKKIDAVAEIDAVIDLPSRDQATWQMRWNNSSESQKSLWDRAKAIIDCQNPRQTANKDFDQGGGVLLFLLSNLHEDVNFQKESPGGVMGKQYFKFKSLKTMDELLAKIKGQKWRSVKDWR